jgi:hypothetical protein
MSSQGENINTAHSEEMERKLVNLTDLYASYSKGRRIELPTISDSPEFALLAFHSSNYREKFRCSELW